ncbi:hypothetical protein TIFTF001_016457 [Ficus carica]|uniref:Uncharacterized protein n=1 Tax=Ficus carica TaxID=3494 RepID=A0AA88DIU8_FICCA|nr:hypothetical protein TIFTF001_016457 [Ficus carica]
MGGIHRRGVHCWRTIEFIAGGGGEWASSASWGNMAGWSWGEGRGGSSPASWGGGFVASVRGEEWVTRSKGRRQRRGDWVEGC